MILRRIGTKAKLAAQISGHFPKHSAYFEPFFGAGGIFFGKSPKAGYNFLNDKDADVSNLFQVFTTRKDELLELIELTPYDNTLFKYWQQNEEADAVRKAMRFLMLSNYSFIGAGDCLRFGFAKAKKRLIENFLKTTIGEDCQFTNCDFREFFGKISFKSNTERVKSFIYADPPYIETRGNYDGFTEQDSSDLFDVLQEQDMRFAYSEFNQPFILNEATKRGLNVTTIGERRNLGNRRTEILVTNYGAASSGRLFA